MRSNSKAIRHIFFYIYIFLTLKQRTSVFERVNQGVIAISYYEKFSNEVISYYEKFSNEVTTLRKSLLNMTFFTENDQILSIFK